jgi:hypothetical protein
MKFYPKPYDPGPCVGDVNTVEKFAYFPVRCPRSGIVFWLQKCIFRYAYIRYCSDPSSKWHLMRITDKEK